MIRGQQLILQGQQMWSSALAEAQALSVTNSEDQTGFALTALLSGTATPAAAAAAAPEVPSNSSTATASTATEDASTATSPPAKKKATKKRKQPQEEGKPKRLSGYLLFCQHMRQQVDKTQFASQAELTTHLGHEWKKLAEDEKSALNARAKTMFDDQMREFEEKRGTLPAAAALESGHTETETETDLETAPVVPAVTSASSSAVPVAPVAVVSQPSMPPTPVTDSLAPMTIPSSSSPELSSPPKAKKQKKSKDDKEKEKEKKKKKKQSKNPENQENQAPAPVVVVAAPQVV